MSVLIVRLSAIHILIIRIAPRTIMIVVFVGVVSIMLIIDILIVTNLHIIVIRVLIMPRIVHFILLPHATIRLRIPPYYYYYDRCCPCPSSYYYGDPY